MKIAWLITVFLLLITPRFSIAQEYPLSIVNSVVSQYKDAFQRQEEKINEIQQLRNNSEGQGVLENQKINKDEGYGANDTEYDDAEGVNTEAS